MANFALVNEALNQDADNLLLLTDIGGISRDAAHRVLRKHNGDMEKAADAILAGDKGEEPVSSSNMQLVKSTPTVIDLTADEDSDADLHRALQMSMDSPQTDSYGPLPDLIPANVPLFSGPSLLDS